MTTRSVRTRSAPAADRGVDPDARPARRPARTHDVAMLVFDDAQVLDVAGPLEVFARTTRWLREHAGVTRPAYATALIATARGPVRTSGGIVLHADRDLRDRTRIDTLLIGGGTGYAAAMADPRLLAWIRARAARARRVASICTGALILARAGLLAGRPATTHWAYFDRLAALEPRARIDTDALYVRSGNLYTSAGVTAGMDLALAFVEQDWGAAVALAVAQELVMYLKRPGGQSQFSRQLAAQRRDDEFGALELWLLEHLDGDLSVPALAARAHMSVRHFARRFALRVGATPADYVLRARVEAARRRLEDGAPRLKQVARETGFADEQALRRAFQRTLGVTPLDYRARFGAARVD